MQINYLAHQVSREGVRPNRENLKAVVNFTLPQTYMEISAFLSLVGHYQQSIKGFASIAQPLHKHLSREDTNKKSEQVMLMVEAKDAFEMLSK